MSIASVGRFVGLIPDESQVFLTGKYRMNERGFSPPATGVVKINGTIVLRVPPGASPFPTTPFQMDISSYSGVHALIEFVPDARYRGTGSVDWIRPMITTLP